MPTARKSRTKKDADSGAAKSTARKRKSREAEAEEDEDEDDEEEETTSTRRKITEEIAQRAAEMREEGATWQDVIDETGFNGAQLRPHIARLTEATIDTLEDSPESVAEHREEGYAWYAMATSLGKTIPEVEEMAEEGGADIEGRQYRKNGAAEDAEDDDEQEEEEAPKAKRGKAKPAAKPKASTAGKKRRKANPSEEDLTEDNFPLLRGRTIYVISPGRRRGDGTKSAMVENRFRVTSVRQWLPAGPMRRGGVRKDDLIEFNAYKGGRRVVRVADVIDIR